MVFERPWFRFNVLRWLGDPDVLAMGWAERGLYIQLLALCWSEGGLDLGEEWPSLPPACLQPFCSHHAALTQLWRSHHAAIRRHFLLIEGRWWNKRLWRERLHAESEAARLAARREKGCTRSGRTRTRTEPDLHAPVQAGPPSAPPPGAAPVGPGEETVDPQEVRAYVEKLRQARQKAGKPIDLSKRKAQVLEDLKNRKSLADGPTPIGDIIKS